MVHATIMRIIVPATRAIIPTIIQINTLNAVSNDSMCFTSNKKAVAIRYHLTRDPNHT